MKFDEWLVLEKSFFSLLSQQFSAQTLLLEVENLLSFFRHSHWDILSGGFINDDESWWWLFFHLLKNSRKSTKKNYDCMKQIKTINHKLHNNSQVTLFLNVLKMEIFLFNIFFFNFIWGFQLQTQLIFGNEQVGRFDMIFFHLIQTKHVRRLLSCNPKKNGANISHGNFNSKERF